MNDHEQGFLCVVCALVFVFCLLGSVTFIVGGKTPPCETCKACKATHTMFLLPSIVKRHGTS